MNKIKNEIHALRRVARSCKDAHLPSVSPYIFATSFRGELRLMFDIYQMTRDLKGLADDHTWDVDEWDAAKVVIKATPGNNNFRMAYRAARFLRGHIAS